MGKTTAGQIREIGLMIAQYAGPEVREQVMEGDARAVASSSPEETALWVKGAMDRLDALVPPDLRRRIMTACGYNCLSRHPFPLVQARRRRKQYFSEVDFLENEIKSPPAGTRLERQGDSILFYYTPRVFRNGMRCYCSLMRGLPEGVDASPTYCLCALGFVEKYWEGILGRPVEVEPGPTSISGAGECRFTIHL